jgi:apolipoprotein N-acyltransferase
MIWKARHEMRALRSVGVLLLGFLSLNGLGLWLSHHLPVPDDKVKVMLVQGNIGNAEKVSAELGMGFQEAILKAFMQTTDQGLAATDPSSLDFVIWPETAFPSVLGRGLRLTPDAETLRSFMASRKINLMTGAYGFDRSKGLMTNSLFVLDQSGSVVEPHYSKTILLAFGEFIPGEELWPGIRNYLPPIGQFARGPGPTVLLAHDRFLMGPQICYESLFAWFSRDLANLGAQFIVNVTNDSWYGYWQEPYQHLYMTLARAIEFRRPVIRTTNTGISTVILADGTQLEQSPINATWTGVYEVPFVKAPGSTFYQRHFHLMSSMVMLLFAILLLSGTRDRWART